MVGWPRTYWRMGQRVNGTGEAKADIAEAVGKPSLNRALVGVVRPEAAWATHGQGEPHRKVGGGPNGSELQVRPMTRG